MTILLTGSSGRIGTSLRVSLPELGWKLRCLDRVAAQPSSGSSTSSAPSDSAPSDSAPSDSAPSDTDEIVADLSDLAALDRAMAGVDAVVHLAGQPTEAPWPTVRDSNIEGVYQLFEAARRAGVARVVYASSNHAVGFTPHGTTELPADTPARPDTLYGVSKVFGEALGRYYVERYGMRVACLRIGTFADAPPDDRALATWLSPGDCARLVDACLRSEDLTFAQVWGVSNNRHRWWSLAAGEALGYHPMDDASQHRSDPGSAGAVDAFVGGGFTDSAFGIAEILDAAGKRS